MTTPYITDRASGEGWALLCGDSCERLAELADESVDLSVYSPPFQSLYIYSAGPRDLGNSAGREEFMAHYGFVIRELFRVTKPGRLSCVHAADVATTKATHGVSGVHDFTGDVIRAHVEAGWVFRGRVFVDKNPQAVAQRTKAQHLLFVTLHKDSAKSAPCAGDQLLLFVRPGDNAVPVVPDVTNDEWIEWARPVWLGIREGRTLNAAIAREDEDERHLHALQLDFIERCVRLYSNPGELVVSPFAGVGSEVYTAVRLGRRGWGCELKPSYWETSVRYLRALEDEMSAPSLLDQVEA